MLCVHNWKLGTHHKLTEIKICFANMTFKHTFGSHECQCKVKGNGLVKVLFYALETVSKMKLLQSSSL